ncbi:hypothetical protein Syun_029061 [Stephania yunnanensis]|uniref:Cytidyltransferase-like domain-containing protein n=1 Tax=Stephania yunnanensis TaxID=152371 RepID=A0AAP0HJ40_9MAGN
MRPSVCRRCLPKIGASEALSQLARDALESEGYHVIGGYMSPVNDAYGKKGLIPANHRIQMCNLACRSSSFIVVDPWEARNVFARQCKVATSVHSRFVLTRIKNRTSENGLISRESLKVMLVCSSDLVESFSKPGVWIPEQLQRRRQELTQTTPDQPVDNEAVYYKVSGDYPKGCVYSLRSLWRKKRIYVDPDASTSQRGGGNARAHVWNGNGVAECWRKGRKKIGWK